MNTRGARMKIEINIDSTDDGMTGDFNITLGDKGKLLLQKLKEVIENPDEFVQRIGNSVVNNVLYGGGGDKTKGSAVAESSVGPAGY
jgi:hypothetical protein